MSEESIKPDIDIHLDIGQLIRAYEEQALTNLFGTQSPSERGMADGGLLNAAQKDKAVVSIHAEFDRQCRRLLDILKERYLELEAEKQRIRNALSGRQVAMEDLEASRHNELVYQKTMNDLIREFNRSVVEQTGTLEQIAKEYEQKLRSIEEELNNELPRQESLEYSGISAYKKLTALMLKFGAPDREEKSAPAEKKYLFQPGRGQKSKPAPRGFFEYFSEKLDSIFKTRIREQQARFDERITFENAQFRYNLEAMTDRAAFIPSRGRALLYSFIAFLVFIVEIPITYYYTTVSLNINTEKGSVIERIMAVILSVGFPLCIGLAFKIFGTPKPINGIQAAKKNPKSWSLRNIILLFFTVILIVSIGFLNGTQESGDLEEYVSKGRTAVFLSITIVLSLVGAQYFDLALQSWSRRLLLGPKRKKNADTNEEMARHKNAILQLAERAILIDLALEKIRKAYNPGEPGQKNGIESAFEDSGHSTSRQYEYGFEAGWRAQVHELFKKRKPVPTHETAIHDN